MGRTEISFSKIGTWKRCFKKYFYKYIDRLVLKKKPGLPRKGSMGHAGLAAHHKGGNWEEAIEKVWDEQLGNYPFKLTDEQKEEKDFIKKIVKRYIEQFDYFRSPDESDFIEPETRYSVNIPNTNVDLMGYMDQVIKVPGEGLWLIENKFTSTDLDKFFDKLELKEQIDYYIWALEQMYPEENVMGCIYNGIRLKLPKVPKPIKSGKRLSKAKITTDYETYYQAIIDNDFSPTEYQKMLMKLENQNNPFFQTEWIDRDPYELKEIGKELMWCAVEIQKTIFPIRNRNMGQCSWDCPYKQLCLVEKKGGDVEGIIEEHFDYYEDLKKAEKEADGEGEEVKPF